MKNVLWKSIKVWSPHNLCICISKHWYAIWRNLIRTDSNCNYSLLSGRARLGCVRALSENPKRLRLGLMGISNCLCSDTPPPNKHTHTSNTIIYNFVSDIQHVTNDLQGFRLSSRSSVNEIIENHERFLKKKSILHSMFHWHFNCPKVPHITWLCW